MAQLRITFSERSIGERLSRSMRSEASRVQRALKGAAIDARTEILARGRTDIANAGNFGSRWTQGLKATVDEDEGDLTIAVTHDIPYWSVHQTGKLIRGRPLLWIPLSFSNAVGIMARDYPGGLFRVNRKVGAPLLLSLRDKQPKYFGIAQVRIPKRFHIYEIIRDVASGLKDFYNFRFRKK